MLRYDPTPSWDDRSGLTRWGEYFAAVATAVFLPLEVRELSEGVTFTRAGALVVNLLALAYLLYAKRLFGLHGGRQAYEDERRGEQLLEVENAALEGVDRDVAGRYKRRP